MNRFQRGLAVLAVILIGSAAAHAEGALLCTVRVPTTAAVDALTAFIDGGQNCSWQAKSVLGLQCPNAEVCYDPTARERDPDGGHVKNASHYQQYDGGYSRDGGLDDGGLDVVVYTNVGPVATVGSACANFLPGTGSPDPFILNLGPSERNISLIASQVADGGVYADCKFLKTLRTQP